MITVIQKFSVALRLSFLLLGIFSANLLADEWPKEIQHEKGKIIIYQPQPDKLIDNVLTGRSAMSIELKDSESPIFGVFWFSAIIETDQDKGTAFVHNFKIDKIRWPESKANQEATLSKIVQEWIPKTGLEISLKRLSASLSNAEIQRKSLDDIKNDPPKIIFAEKLSLLLAFDGKPYFTQMKGSDYKRAVNTGLMVVQSPDTKTYYLTNGTDWYQAKAALGPWKASNTPPSELIKMMETSIKENAVKQAETAQELPVKIEKQQQTVVILPEIIVTTEATELVVTSGKPNWQSLEGNKLLYVNNTETPWLKDIKSNQNYVLISGRWFHSKSLSGPWVFSRADRLPESFSSISPASEIAGVRASIAGTDEANDAMMDYQIPQTAAISRSEAKLTVNYDGEPEFKEISGTSVSYAVNTGTQVLQIGIQFYAVDNAVWFVAPTATGPWRVADKIPQQQIAEIPASSSVYNTTYAKVYSSTATTVYVGYTPGYMWNFPYYGVPIYGSGWYYPPYYGRYYYPMPLTWGVQVGYTPYYGWGYGYSYARPYFWAGYAMGHHYNYGYHPYRWHGGYHRPIGYHGGAAVRNGHLNISNSLSAGVQARGKNIPRNSLSRNNTSNASVRKNNLYNRPENSKRNSATAKRANQYRSAGSTTGRKNNIYADRNGNVVRRNNNQWESRNNGSWKKDANLNRPVTAESFQKSLDKSQRKSRTTSRNNTYNRQQSLNNSYNARRQGSRQTFQNRSPMRRRR